MTLPSPDREPPTCADPAPRSARSRRGSTLIEVVVAMTILAVGLLALQALTLAAIRSATMAERNTRAVALGTRYLEESVDHLRRGELPAPFACTLDGGDHVERRVLETGMDGLAAVEVRVVPEPRGSPPQPYTLLTHGYSSSGFVSAGADFVCP